MLVATVVVSLLLATTLAMSTVRKFTGARDSMQLREQLGLSPGLWNTVGLLEGAAVGGLLAGLVYAPIAIAAATGTVLLMIGAVGVHVRRGLIGTTLARPAVVGLTATAAVALHCLSL